MDIPLNAAKTAVLLQKKTLISVRNAEKDFSMILPSGIIDNNVIYKKISKCPMVSDYWAFFICGNSPIIWTGTRNKGVIIRSYEKHLVWQCTSFCMLPLII